MWGNWLDLGVVIHIGSSYLYHVKTQGFNQISKHKHNINNNSVKRINPNMTWLLNK